MLLVYFIPYLYLYGCFLVARLRESPPSASVLGGRPAALVIGVCGFAFTLFAMIIASVPPGQPRGRASCSRCSVGPDSASQPVG